LTRAHEIVKILETEIHADFFVLADSAYSECCVDFVAAKHIDAALIVHFGNVCDYSMTPGTVPVIFMVSPVDASRKSDVLAREIRGFVDNLLSSNERQQILVILGQEESFFFCDAILCTLKDYIEQRSLVLDDSGCFTDFCRNGIELDGLSAPDTVLFVGEDGPFFTNIKLKFFMKNIFIISSDSTSVSRIDRYDMNRLITKR
jgi:diphthamide biosynthesis enzyme Dph1/Dph2-like protein